LKLSRTSWIIISAGVFVVILAGLGLTYSQQAKEKSQLSDDLSISEMRLDKLQFSAMQQDLDELQEQIDENVIRMSEDKDRLRQPIESIDVTDEFFLIASYCDVMVMNISSSKLAEDSLKGIPCSTIALSSSVNGTVTDLINFVISLNNDYSAGVVESAQITIPEASANISTTATANIRMTIYSYEGD
jgi:hypothetical protein